MVFFQSLDDPQALDTNDWTGKWKPRSNLSRKWMGAVLKHQATIGLAQSFQPRLAQFKA